MSDNTQRDAPAGGSSSTPGDPTGSRPPVQSADRRFSPPLVAAIVLGALLVIGVAVAGIVLGPTDAAPPTPPPTAAEATGPVLLVPVDAPKAGSAECATLLRELPATLGSGGSALHARKLADPAPPAAAAWGRGDDPVVLRCGIERPPELRPTSELLQVDGVNWFQVSADGSATWYAVDRAAVVALTLPGNVGSTGPLQDVSAAISATMPQVPVF